MLPCPKHQVYLATFMSLIFSTRISGKEWDKQWEMHHSYLEHWLRYINIYFCLLKKSPAASFYTVIGKLSEETYYNGVFVQITYGS